MATATIDLSRGILEARINEIVRRIHEKHRWAGMAIRHNILRSVERDRWVVEVELRRAPVVLNHGKYNIEIPDHIAKIPPGTLLFHETVPVEQFPSADLLAHLALFGG